MSDQAISDIRRRAWETRRARYGQGGHASAYRRAPAYTRLLMLAVRLHREGVLSEGQVARAAGIDRVEVRRLADQGRSVVVGDRALACVDHSLDLGCGCLAGQAEKISALAGGSLLDADLPIGDFDDCPAGRAVDLGQNVVEISASHHGAIVGVDDSGQSA